MKACVIKFRYKILIRTVKPLIRVEFFGYFNPPAHCRICKYNMNKLKNQADD